MKKSVIKSAKTVEEAIKIALTELGTTEDKVDIDVIEEPSSGFLGILGVKHAIVKVVEKEDNENSFSTIIPKKVDKKVQEVKKDIKPIKEEAKKEIRKETQDESFDIVSFLQEVCDGIMPGCEVKIESENKEEINLEIEGDNLGLIVGKHGETLNALQYITAMVYNSKFDKFKRVNVDAGGYRKKREEKIVDFGVKMAHKVKNTGRRISLEPMNSYERRIVHLALQDIDGINTFSEGREPHRKIVITSTGKPNKPTKSYKNKRNNDNQKKDNYQSQKKDSYQQKKEDHAREERQYKSLEKQHDQLNGQNEKAEDNNPYEHYYSKYDNRIKKK